MSHPALFRRSVLLEGSAPWPTPSRRAYRRAWTGCPGRLALARGGRAGDGLDPRRARGHDRRRDRVAPLRAGRARHQRIRGRGRRDVLHRGRGGGRARLRLPDRPARAQEALPRQLGLYLVATVLTGLTWSAASFWAFRF